MHIAVYIGESLPGASPATGYAVGNLLPLLPPGSGEPLFFIVRKNENKGSVEKKQDRINTYFRPAWSLRGPGKWWWINVVLRRLIRTRKIDVLISVNGALGAGIQVPEVVVDEGKMQAFLETRRINLPRGILPGFVGLDWDQASEIRDTFSSGRTYLFCSGPVNETMLPLIRAFSIFKKRQKTDWRMILADTGKPDRVFRESLNHYRYRDDVTVIDVEFIDQVPTLLAASYAAVFTPGAATGLLIPECFACGIPVIAEEKDLPAIFTVDTILPYSGHEPVNIADAMMQLYKDEALRARLVKKGTAAIETFGWERAVQDLKAFLGAVHQ